MPQSLMFIGIILDDVAAGSTHLQHVLDLFVGHDTVGAISCSVAEAYYGVDYDMEQKALDYLSEDLLSIYYAFSLIKKPRKNN